MRRALTHDMKGQYYEINNNGEVRFFEIHYINYSIESVQRLKEIDSLNTSHLGIYMSLINDPIPDSTNFLYMLETYIGKTGIDDLSEFNNNMSNYERYGFYDLEKLLKYCKEKWGIDRTDFKSIVDTNIPY
jgi:hypothetical protein